MGRSDKVSLILAAGGTGGHIFPAQALGEEMLERGWDVELWTDRRGFRFTNGFPAAIGIRKLPSATFARRGIWRYAAPALVALGIVISLWRLLIRRPLIIVGFGGYPAFPPLIAAVLARVPRLIHEQNGVLGKVNRLLARRVELVACGAVSTVLPEGAKSVQTGNPVRTDVAERASSPYLPPDGGRVNILVVGGSQGAKLLDCHVPAAVARLSQDKRSRLLVCQQVMHCQHSIVERFYREAGIACEIRTFFDDIPERLVDAHIVISRAGASAVAEIALIGRPSILIPYAAAANDHQTANALGLVEAGAAVILQEGTLTSEALASELQSLLDDPDRLARMARSADKISQSDAAANLANLVEEVALGATRG